MVAAHRTGIPMSGRVVLSIVPDEGSRGRLIHKMILKEKDLYSINRDRARLKMERIVVTAFAGIEAQRRYNPNSIDYGDKSAAFGNWDGGSDYHEAANLISSFTGPKRKMRRTWIFFESGRKTLSPRIGRLSRPSRRRCWKRRRSPPPKQRTSSMRQLRRQSNSDKQSRADSTASGLIKMCP